MAKISDALHLAADKYLARDWSSVSSIRRLRWWSCWAVEEACNVLGVNCIDVKRGLENMGLNTQSNTAFLSVKDPQGARYMWLKFAALMAEEQGL